jgi:outer membrane protein assembly factor BamB
MKICFSITIILFLLFTVSCKPQTDWTKWRGENGDGVSKETNWDPLKLDQGHILWKKNIGFGHSAIAVKGKNCFVTGWSENNSGKDTIGETTVSCLDISNGKEVWKYCYPSAKINFPGPRSTPVIDGNCLYGMGWQGELFCLNTDTGKENWKVNLVSKSYCLTGPWGICPSPLIYRNLILLNLNKSGLAIAKDNGDVVWRSELKNAHYSTVKLVKYKNKTAGVFMCDTIINLVDPFTGKILATYSKETNKSMENDAMITSVGNLFISDELIDMKGQTLKSVWKNDTVSSIFRVGAILGDYAYQFSDNKNKSPLMCVDVRSGKPSWSVDLGKFGSLTIVGQKLIILTGFGKVIIADAKPDRFTIVKELQVLPSENIEKNLCWTSPTFSGGKLFIRNSGGDIACIDLSI